jgi:FAD/FMN-containing dehydrogenase
MTRRELIAAIATLPGLFTGGGPGAAFAALARPRVRPGDAGWPTVEDWAGLNRQVGGRLIQPTSVLAACTADGRSRSCADAKKLLRNPYFLGDQPAGTQVSGWLDAWTPHPSAYALVAANAADVAAAVNFARDHNVRLVVKGGGHSYQGTSTAPDSLLVWTRRMRRIDVHDRFVPLGCERRVDPTPAVSVEAGAMWMDVYDAVTTKLGRYVQGGGCATVGVAGLIQSGGFGSFSKRFGLAAASLLEAEVITADGAVRIVNTCKDADLFWALKGGGGGTFGAVTRVTLRTYDLPPFFGSATARICTHSDEAFNRLIAQFVDFYAQSLFNPHWGESVSIRPDRCLEIAMVCQGLTHDEANAVWGPFFDWVAASPADYSFAEKPNVGVRPARSWWDVQGRRAQGSTALVFDERSDAEAGHAWWSGDQEQVSAFLHGYDSLWLPADLLAPAERTRFVLGLVAASRHTAVMLHFNKGLAGAPSDVIRAARETGMNPDVTSAFALAIVATGGPAPYPELGTTLDRDQMHRNAQVVSRAAEELRRIAPRAGSYLSESNFFNARWKRDFWGAHHARLLAIKQRFDPTGLFYVHHGVGSDAWRKGGFVRA